jgi:hypothetical protein
VIVMLDQKCDDGDCGYVRPGAVAYRESKFAQVIRFG